MGLSEGGAPFQGDHDSGRMAQYLDRSETPGLSPVPGSALQRQL